MNEVRRPQEYWMRNSIDWEELARELANSLQKVLPLIGLTCPRCPITEEEKTAKKLLEQVRKVGER